MNKYVIINELNNYFMSNIGQIAYNFSNMKEQAKTFESEQAANDEMEQIKLKGCTVIKLEE